MNTYTPKSYNRMSNIMVYRADARTTILVSEDVLALQLRRLAFVNANSTFMETSEIEQDGTRYSFSVRLRTQGNSAQAISTTTEKETQA